MGDRRVGRLGDAAPRRRAPRAGATRFSKRSSCPADWLPPVLESPERAGLVTISHKLRRGRRRGRGRPAGGGDRCRCRSARAGARSSSAPPGSSWPRSLRYAHDPRGPRPRVLPRRPGHLAGDGRDALGRRFARVVPRAARRRRVVRGARRGGGALGARSRRAPFLPYLAGERTPHADPDARGAFVGLSCATTVAHSSARSSKAWRSASATRSTCSASSVRRRRSDASRAAGRGAALAAHRRLRARLPLEHDRVGARFGVRRGPARRRRGRGLRRRPRGRHALCPCPRDDRAGSGVGRERTPSSTLRHQALYPALHAG